MLQFDLQFYEELTVAWVRTVKFISGALFWPTGQLVKHDNYSAVGGDGGCRVSEVRGGLLTLVNYSENCTFGTLKWLSLNSGGL